MKILKIDQIPKEPATNPLFTGGKVTRQALIGQETSRNFFMAVVNFGKGSRNKFHRHSGDQVLIVTAGKGIVATEQEKKVVYPGDIVFFAAGEKHWHGATEDSEFSQIYISVTGASTEQLED